MRHMSTQEEDRLVRAVGSTFRTFGGGSADPSNPISMALKDADLQFAAGVDVRLVVRFIWDQVQMEEVR